MTVHVTIALDEAVKARLDALADGSGRPSFLPAEADDLIGTDPGAGSELLVYARPVAARARSSSAASYSHRTISLPTPISRK